MNGGNELKKTFRADAGPTLEESLEMVFTQADCPGDFPKSRLALKIIFYEKYSAFNALVSILYILHRAPPVVIITNGDSRINPILAAGRMILWVTLIEQEKTKPYNDDANKRYGDDHYLN